MIAADGLMFEVGIVMLVSFIGAALASKAKQSVILGYIVAGVLIGPYIFINVGGFTYDGLIKDTSFIQFLSTMGLTLLMFFVGLGFSVTKLKKTKTPAILLALINVGVNMFVGILLGLSLGWPIVDTVFLAGVFAMSSAAITGKSLMEQERMGAPETEFLLGMVIVENFLSMILLTIAGGLMFKTGVEGSLSVPRLVFGILVFYSFFIFLAIVLIPRVVKYFQKIKSDELFVLFALGLVFLSAALAEASGVPGIIGAFFLGMVFAETKLAERFDNNITPIKDALVAVFFVSFGMMIDPSMIPQIIWIVIIAAPLVVIDDLLFTGAVAYLFGFSAKGSVFMGASICGRGAESVMFASVGANSPAVSKGVELNPFAGAFCFIMSIITPTLMKTSNGIAKHLGRWIPLFLRYGGAITSRTLGKVILPSGLRLFQRTRRLEVGLVLYFVTLIAVMITTGLSQVLLFAGAMVISFLIYRVLESEMYAVVRMTNYDNLGMVSKNPSYISRYIASFVLLALMTILVIALLFGIVWQSSLLVLLWYFIAILYITHRLFVNTKTPSLNLKSRSVKPRSVRGRQRSFQPNFQAPPPHPDPGWGSDIPSSSSMRTSPGRGEPGSNVEHLHEEMFAQNKPSPKTSRKIKAKEKSSPPEQIEADEEKWGRL